MPFLTRGRVCNLLLLLVLASAVTLGLPSLTRGRVCLLSVSVHSQSVCTKVIYIRYLHYLCLTQFRDVYTIYTRPLSVQAQHSRLCLSLCEVLWFDEAPNVSQSNTICHDQPQYPDGCAVVCSINWALPNMSLSVVPTSHIQASTRLLISDITKMKCAPFRWSSAA
jgi:hypothetical protein